MSEEPKPNLRLEIVLFLDIVGYSKLLISEQSGRLQKLKEIARGTEQFRSAEAGANYFACRPVIAARWCFATTWKR